MLVWNKIFVINSFIICEVYDYFDDKTTFHKKRVSLLIVSLQNRRVIFNSILNKTFDNLIHNKNIPINYKLLLQMNFICYIIFRKYRYKVN